MKIMMTLLIPFLLLLDAAPVRAMDADTRDQVIQRLERILSQMNTGERAWIGTNLRLADLLAERARQRFIVETEEGCDACKGSRVDRRKAVDLYENVLKRPSGYDEGVILLQLAHLYEQGGEDKKSEALFKKVLGAKAGRYSSELVDRARTSLADMYFLRGRNKEALKLYQEALSKKTTAHRGLIRYRIAWSQFHLGQLSKATTTLERLARDRSALTRLGTEGPSYDEGFHNDVVRDLAIFYSRRPIQRKDVQRYQQLSPKSSRASNLQHFGEEADRIGQKAAAEWIYQAYLQQPDLTPEQQLEALIRLAQIKYDRGQGTASTAEFALAAKRMKAFRCESEEQCEKLQKRMKYYVTELHRSRKTNVSIEVAKAYFIYSQTFPSDLEMSIRGAQVAMDLKEYTMAVNLYRDASLEADRQIKAKTKGADQKQLTEWRRVAVLGEVEAAELTNKLSVREAAYRHALRLIPDDSESFLIRYQLARIPYEQKKWSAAATAFRDLALDKSGSAEIRKKSADLALDSLVLEKRDAQIEIWALEFAAAMPAHADEFRRLSRKAVMAQVAQVANNPSASRQDLDRTLQKLLKTDVTGATEAEKQLHLKNTVVVARKVGDKDVLMKALGALLAMRSLSAGDREDTLAQLVGEYESRLDFKSAYETARKMRFPSLSRAEKERRLGTLADLAGLSPTRHYVASLRAGLKGSAALALRARLVSLSKQPLQELNAQARYLKADPVLFADVLLTVYGKTRNLPAVRRHTKARAMQRQAPVRFMEKQPYYMEHQTLARRLANHQLRSRSDRQIQTSIKERLDLLRQADDSVKKAVRLNDFTAQVISLNTVAVENSRMAQDLMSLPTPAGLSPEERAQYLTLLQGQANPYVRKANVVRQKLNEFWGNGTALGHLIAEHDSARPEIKPLLRDELRLLAMIAPSSPKSRIERSLSLRLPEARDLQAAREKVRRSPRDPRSIENLKKLETKIGHPLMSSYLESRLNMIQKGDI